MIESNFLIFFINYLPILYLVILALNLGFLIFSKNENLKQKIIKISFWLIFTLVFLKIILLFVFQYFIWKIDNPYFLPPYQDISYFLRYAAFHFAFNSILSVITSLILFFIINFANKISKDKFFYKDEVYLSGIAILTNPWPNNLLVFLLVPLAALILMVIFIVIKKSLDYRINWKYLWLIIGLILLIFGNQLIKILNLEVLKV
jgi:hypothetical protein